MQRNWSSLIQPKGIDIDEATHTHAYGEFSCQPLERGFGTTLGNALRRVLLSSIQGAAIVSVKFDGVLHEFSTIPGIKEDVTDIILNLKGVRLKLHQDGPRTIHIDTSKQGVITAADIVTDGTVEILNPDHYLATLVGKASLKVEMVAKMGKGYIPAQKEKDPEQPEGTINIDAIFSPIKKVNYTVTYARVGQVADYDKLIMEIWTDGSVLPDDALAYAAKILKEQLDVFINFPEVGGGEKLPDATPLPEDPNDVLIAACGRSGTLRPVGKLPEKCRYQLDRGTRWEDRGGDAQDQELWQEITK